ncbi:hypothetical protein ACFL27_05540 [candidate division CSSED10-310 bacterium]|uniref:Uncharacterized protein n=1 Tax=candidate division CSSED10-310 bacterium TaxID=2855610 RepID=A0ABV6YTW8_UNCC1
MAAAGGKKKIEAIKTVFFDSPSRNYDQIIARYFASTTGKLKIVNEIYSYVWAVSTYSNGEYEIKTYVPQADEQIWSEN